jgi:hypothetical protein
MSLIRVDKITGKTGSDAGAPIVFSGDTATIGSAVTLPVSIKAVKWGLLTSEYGSKDPVGDGASDWIFHDADTTNVSAPAGFMGSNTLVSHSSGIWSFAETGYYMIWAIFLTIFNTGGSSAYNYCMIKTSHDYTTGPTWYVQGEANQFTTTAGQQTSVNFHTLLKITNIAEQKFKFVSTLQGGSGQYILGQSTRGDASIFTVLKLGNI